MNTKIEYQYRDGDNYKQNEEVILKGTLTAEEIKQIFAELEDGEHFIPSQVGLQDLQSRMTSFPGDADHVWHELEEGDITETELEPTTKMTAKQLLINFREVTWDVTAAMDELGL